MILKQHINLYDKRIHKKNNRKYILIFFQRNILCTMSEYNVVYYKNLLYLNFDFIN